MSLFDSVFASGVSATMQSQFGNDKSVSIELGGIPIVTMATGISGAERTIEVQDGERITKQIEMDLSLRRDQKGLPNKGLKKNMTAGVAIVDGVRWNINGIDNRTESYVTLKLIRKTSREQSTVGMRRQED